MSELASPARSSATHGFVPDTGRRRFLGGVLAAPFVTTQALAQGAGRPRSAGPANGTLLIMGGGAVGPHVAELARTLTKGDGARWVYIPTALRDEQIASARPPAFCPPHARILHTRERITADSAAFTAPLREAMAVYIEGGRQWRLADAYVGTRTEAELNNLLARGGLIAGASAGASIMASFLVRGSPMGNGLVMSPGHERGFGFITHCAIDQHVIRRRRQSDLALIVAKNPDILGIGLDEGAAILVRGECLTAVNDRAILITDGADHGGLPYYRLPHRARFDLASWREA